MHSHSFLIWTMSLLLPLAACGDSAALGGCDDFPADAAVASGSLGSEDTCGRWALAVGEHLYINVDLTEPDQDCTGTTTGGVTLPYDPIYSNPSNSSPRWTFDVEGVEAGEGALDVSCAEGSTWGARFTVTAR